MLILHNIGGGPQSAANGPQPTPTARPTSTTSAAALAGKALSPPRIPRSTARQPTQAPAVAAKRPTLTRPTIRTTTRNCSRHTQRPKCLPLRRGRAGSTGPGILNRLLSGATRPLGKMGSCLRKLTSRRLSVAMIFRTLAIYRIIIKLGFGVYYYFVLDMTSDALCFSCFPTAYVSILAYFDIIFCRPFICTYILYSLAS